LAVHSVNFDRRGLTPHYMNGILAMAWRVETSEEFDAWWAELDERSQDALAVVIGLLQRDGPQLPRPYADKLRGSKVDLRELRDTVHDDTNAVHVYRILYVFDPLRQAFLCLGGDKAGDKRWYRRNVPRAEAIYRVHLARLKRPRET
jgi:hypothetical protein